MKTVFDNSMTAHVWAQQSQPFGRSNNGQTYFEGPNLYSYGSHYVTGTIDRNGVAWLNSDSYSPTTGKHQSHALRAVLGRYHRIPALTGIYRAILVLAGDDSAWQVPYGLSPADRRAARKAWLAREFSAYFKSHWAAFPADSAAAAILWRAVSPSGKWAAARARYAAKAAKLEKVNKARLARINKEAAARYAATPLAVIRARFSEAAGNCGAWDRARQLSEMVSDISAAHKAAGGKRIKAAVWERLKLARALKARLIDLPETRKEARAALAGLRRLFAGDYSEGGLTGARLALAKAVKERDNRRAVLKACRMPSTLRLAWQARLEALADSIAELERERERERMAEQEADRLAWLAGAGPSHAYDLKDERGGALIRAENVESDGCSVTGGELVTSQGARVPLPHAVRAFAFVRAVRERGEPWERKSGVGPRVGHFTVDRVESSGDFVAGCHVINWGEVERLARLLGVWDCPAELLESGHGEGI